jgi:hypothetical protein
MVPRPDLTDVAVPVGDVVRAFDEEAAGSLLREPTRWTGAPTVDPFASPPPSE